MNFRSLNPRYAWARLRENRFARRFPGTPWLTENSVRLLDGWLKSTDTMIEWGSGRSTLWFAKRTAKILSIEDNPEWHAIVSKMIKDNGVAGKVDYRLIGCSGGDFGESETSEYALAAECLPDGSVDFALVDGGDRLTCMQIAMRKLKSGGLLALDNANRFLPNLSLGAASTIHEPRTEYKTAGWKKLADDLRGWRFILTTDQIWNTLFWVKPPV